MSRYVRIKLEELEHARLVVRGLSWWLIDGYETYYIDRRRLRREIRRAYRRVQFMSDLSPFAWERAARRHGVHLPRLYRTTPLGSEKHE